MPTSYYVNKNIRNATRVFSEQGRRAYHRYDMNENPQGLPKEFVDSVLSEITPSFLATYPEPVQFTEKYAEFIGACSDQVLATNGSDMAIRYILEVFGEPGKDVVTVTPSFEMYRVNCDLLGLVHRGVAYESDLTIRIESILNAITPDTRVVVLLNPNNPVGNVYSPEEVDAVIAKASDFGAIVVIDEAYYYFYDQTYLDRALCNDNVLVLRTFSKLLSIAACRLGVVVGNSDLIHYLTNAKLTFDVNSFALLFGQRILENPALIDELIAIEKKGKQFILDALEAEGYAPRDCRGNFIFVQPKNPVPFVEQALRKDHKVLVKTFGNDLLKNFIRVSVGSEEDMKVFLDAFLKVEAQA